MDGLDKIKILIIDDQPWIRALLRNCLRSQKIHNIIEADNGKEALDIFNVYGNADDDKRPDLIICDLIMEKMDGLEFVQKVRRGRSPLDSNTPILLLTGDKEDLLKDVGLQLGATRVLSKPISTQELSQEIQRAIGFQG